MNSIIRKNWINYFWTVIGAVVILAVGGYFAYAVHHDYLDPKTRISQVQVAEYTTVKPNRYLFRTDGRERRRPQPQTRSRSRKKK